MARNESFETTLRDMHEFEEFMYELFDKLPADELQHGESLIPHTERLGIAVPGSLQATEMTWRKDNRSETEGSPSQVLVLTRPGQPEALGLTIGCIGLGRHVRVCLECGWFYCRIVIYIYLLA